MSAKKLAVLPLVLLAAGCGRDAAKKAESTALAITHVTVVDMTGAAPRPDQTVLVDRQRITGIGPARTVAVPAGAQTLDGSGKFLIPGLVDSHVHLTGAGEPGGSREFIIPLLVASGITTVRDMGGYLESLLPLRAEIAKGQRIGPRIFLAGPYLDGAPPAFEPSLVVTSQVQASEDVRALIDRGVDFLKVQSHLSRDSYMAIAGVARREHISFAGHVPDGVTAWEAADAGQKSIEHLTNVLRGCSSEEARLLSEQSRVPPREATAAESKERQLRWQGLVLRSFSKARESQLIARFVARGTWQTPTLLLLETNAYPTAGSPAPDSRARYVPRKILEGWKRGHAGARGVLGAQASRLNAELFEKSMQVVADMQKGGVKLLAGTDTTAPSVFPGSSLGEELALLVKAGLTPAEALAAATRNPAEFLGQLESQGTIETGKFADLVLLDRDPLADIRNTGRIRAVVLHGKLLDRAALDGMLQSVEEFARRN